MPVTNLCQVVSEELDRVVNKGDVFTARVKIVHPMLLSWMGLTDSAEIHHDVQVRE